MFVIDGDHLKRWILANWEARNEPLKMSEILWQIEREAEWLHFAYKVTIEVKEKPHWCPCSNELPGDEDWYLVTVHPDYVYSNSRATDTLYWREGKWWYINDGLKLEVFPDPIIAWMNLPDAYEGYEEEEEE